VRHQTSYCRVTCTSARTIGKNLAPLFGDLARLPQRNDYHSGGAKTMTCSMERQWIGCVDLRRISCRPHLQGKCSETSSVKLLYEVHRPNGFAFFSTSREAPSLARAHVLAAQERPRNVFSELDGILVGSECMKKVRGESSNICLCSAITVHAPACAAQ
jgi:hypothetical protein